MRRAGALVSLLDSPWLSRAGNGILVWNGAVFFAGVALLVWNATLRVGVLTAIAVAVMVFGLLMQAVVLVSRRRGRAARGVPLADECRTFAHELGQFEAARRHGRPTFKPGTIAENLQARASGQIPMSALSAAGRYSDDPVGDRSRKAIVVYDRETLREYHDRFGTRGTALFDRAHAEGIADARDEALVTEPRSPDDLREIVARFRGYADVADPVGSAERRRARLAVSARPP